MVQVKEMQFATTIGVLFALKEAKGYKTLEETYKLFEKADMDVMIEIVKISYMKQNKLTSLTVDQFVDILETHDVGFIKVTDIFQQIIEALMYSGLSTEELAAKKKLTDSLMQKK